MTEYGNRLQRLRGNRDLNETARALGVTPEALRAYEEGKRLPRDEVRLRMEDYYGRKA